MRSKPQFDIAPAISDQAAQPNERRPGAGQPSLLPTGPRATGHAFQIEIRQKRVYLWCRLLRKVGRAILPTATVTFDTHRDILRNACCSGNKIVFPIVDGAMNFPI